MSMIGNLFISKFNFHKIWDFFCVNYFVGWQIGKTFDETLKI